MKSILQKILISFFAFLISGHASAIMISDGDTFTVDWFVDLADDLSATSTWSVDFLSSTQIQLDISITNTTILTGSLTNADITAFGFGVAPDATASFVTGGEGSIFDMRSDGNGPQQTFPGGFKGIDVCVFASGPCSGGSVNNALHAGDTDTLSLLLTGSFGDTAELLYFPLKFQTSQGSYEPGGCVDGDGCDGVPEPSILALLGIGLAIIGFNRRKVM